MVILQVLITLLNNYCPSLLSVSVIKHSDQEKPREERVHLAITFRSQQGRNSSKNLKQNHRRILLTGFLTGSYLALFIIQARTKSFDLSRAFSG